MFEVVASKRFGRDYKKCMKKHLPIELLDNLIITLAENKPLPAKYKAHKLEGEFFNCWECHLQPDWLLIWQKNETEETIYLVRTGTHSDLFK